MKKHSVKSFVCGFLCAILVTAFVVPALASTGTKTLTATFNNIQVKLDGKLLNLHDAAGKTVEPFVIDGTTYLPIRAISEALGLGVDWNSSSNTVILTSKPEAEPSTAQGEKTSMAELTAFINPSVYQSNIPKNNEGTAGFTKGLAFANRQTAYWTDNMLYMEVTGLYVGQDPGVLSATYLVGNYQAFTAYAASIDGKGDTFFRFYDGDTGTLLKEVTLKQGEQPVQINIDLTGVDKLKISAKTRFYQYGLMYAASENGALYNAYLIA